MESDFLQQIGCICRDQSSVSWFGAQLYPVSIIQNRANSANDSIKPLCLVGSFSSTNVSPRLLTELTMPIYVLPASLCEP